MANYGHHPYTARGAPAPLPPYLATPYGFPYGGGGWDVSLLGGQGARARGARVVFSARRGGGG